LFEKSAALVFAFAVLIVWPVQAKQTPLACTAPNAQPIAPNDMHGVVSRIQINPKAGRSLAYTVQPALEDQDVGPWMRRLEEAGANMAQLFIQPADTMAAAEVIGHDEWSAYIDAALVPSHDRTQAQQDTYKKIRQRIAMQNGVKGITPDQQNQVLLAFLRQLETLKKDGKICGNIQFIVVERRWFPTAAGPMARALGKQLSSETVYARTMADFVNKAGMEGLDHWLAGILVAEHTNTDMNQVLPIAVDLAVRINGLTQGWLHSHFMAMAGGGFGDQFNGIGDVVCPEGADRPDGAYQFTCKPGQPLDFFSLISKQTGTFAFAYKLFNWKTAPTPPSYCAAHIAACDPRNMTVANWTDYLSDSSHGLGFSDLAAFIGKNAASYPSAANVIFIGNASDSIFRMADAVSGPSGNTLLPRPALTALATLFQNASHNGGGWLGRMFMDAYGDQDRLNDDSHMSIDNGSYLFYVDHSPYDFTGTGTVTPNPQSQAFWRSWPQLPTQH
jgi:hypothetical protein